MSPSVFQGIIPEERIRRMAPLREYTTMRVGGPADYMVFPATEQEIENVINRSREAGLPVLVMGNGSNLLFSDDGFRGVILRIGKEFSSVRCEDGMIEAQAGALLAALSRAAADHSLTGLEFASGIPGSVGGAVCMNAGAYGGEIRQVLESARVYADGRIETWSNEALRLSYRHSAVMERDCVILSARFALSPGSRDTILATMNDLNARRRAKQPLQYPSCGSFFKRPEGHFAGALIEQAGLKGFSVGDAQVSELHAGFIINRGAATAGDIYALMRAVQKRVFDQSGVLLEPEVKLIGQFES